MAKVMVSYGKVSALQVVNVQGKGKLMALGAGTARMFDMLIQLYTYNFIIMEREIAR